MTPENRELLFKDLCGRVPYEVIVCIDGTTNVKLASVSYWEEVEVQDGSRYLYDIADIKPYLFPLSSMTEEQKKFFKDRPIFLDFENELVVKEDFFGNSRFTMLEDWMEVIIWLLKNHFDIYGLIPKGLAIDATNLNIYRTF